MRPRVPCAVKTIYDGLAYRLQYSNADVDVDTSAVAQSVQQPLYLESLPRAFWTFPPIAPSVAGRLLVMLYPI